MTPRDSRGPPSGCPPSWDWPRRPPCCSSAGPSTPRWGHRPGPGSRGRLLRRALPRGRPVLAVQRRRQRPPRGRQCGVPGRRGRRRGRRHAGRLPARHLRRGPGPRARDRRRGVGGGGLQRGDGRRAAAGGLGTRLAHQAELASAGAAVAVRLRDPPGLGAERGEHAADQPHVHHPDGPGRAIRDGGDRRVRGRGAAGVPADPLRVRRGLGAGPPGRRQRRGGGLRPRPQADPRRRGAGRGGLRAGGGNRRPVPVGVDGAVHLGPRGGEVRRGVPGPGRPGLRLPRAGAGPVFRRPGARADGEAAAGHPDPAAGRRGAGLPWGWASSAGGSTPCSP